jgi:hypothetical protein
VTSLPNQVDDRPMVFALLEIIESQLSKFATSEPTTQKSCQDRPVTFPIQCFSIRKLPERTSLFSCQPIPKPNTQLLCSFNAGIPASSSGLNNPESAASYASLRTAASLPLMVPGAKRRSSK